MNAPSDIRFSLAGLQVELVASRPGDLRELAGHYKDYTPSIPTSPHLRVRFATDPDLVGPAPLPDHPAFRARAENGGIRLERFDAIGDVTLPKQSAEPVALSFRSGGNRHSLEAAVRIGVSIALPRVGGLLLHASAVATDRGALVFLGQSGAGKSTISSMLHEAWPGCEKISDELLAVVADDSTGGWRAHVTPFLGGDGLPHGRSWPLAEVYLLHQAREHRRSPLSPARALPELLRNALAYVAEAETADRVLGLAARLSRDIPCYELHFLKDPGVGRVLGVA